MCLHIGRNRTDYAKWPFRKFISIFGKTYWVVFFSVCNNKKWLVPVIGISVFWNVDRRDRSGRWVEAVCDKWLVCRSNLHSKSRLQFNRGRQYFSKILDLPTFRFLFELIIYACKRWDFKGTFYMHLRGMSETIYFVHMYFVAFCSLVLYKESYHNFKS